MKRSMLIAGIAAICAACGATQEGPSNILEPTVIEIATFKLKDGVAPAAFAPLDAAVETNHVSLQPGFVSRETGFTEQGDWLVIVHWESIAAAEASMASFAEAPAAADFMGSLDMSSMSMKRYEINE